MFEARDIAEQFVASRRTVIEIVAERDSHLGSQLRRAAISAALNTSEGGRRTGRDRAHAFRIAAGECDEAMCAVRIAIALGWLALRAMLWRPCHLRR